MKLVVKMARTKGERFMLGSLFAANPCAMTGENCAAIFDKSHR